MARHRKTSTNATLRLLVALSVAWVASGCQKASGGSGHEAGGLVGAWRATLQFSSGAFATIKDLEFMYVFNEGGTMTESSNYDGAPPVPPGYGVWRRIGPRQFEAKYAFYATKPPDSLGTLMQGG